MRDVSVDLVVAVRNEAESIPVFVQAVKDLDLDSGVAIRTIFVEDGSTDATLEVLGALAHRDPSVSYYSLEGSRGQTSAIAFGMLQSRADAVITMDVDDGHPVSLIPEMVRRFCLGADVVQATRRGSGKRRWYRKFGTYAFNAVFYALTGVNTTRQNVYYRLMSRHAKVKFLGHTRWLHFLRTNFSREDDVSIQYVEFRATSRRLGKSKYSILRLARMAALAPLSAISGARLGLILVLLAGAAVLLFIAGQPVAGMAILAVAAALALGFSWMTWTSPLSGLIVRESSAIQRSGP